MLFFYFITKHGTTAQTWGQSARCHLPFMTRTRGAPAATATWMRAPLPAPLSAQSLPVREEKTTHAQFCMNCCFCECWKAGMLVRPEKDRWGWPFFHFKVIKSWERDGREYCRHFIQHSTFYRYFKVEAGGDLGGA